MGSIGINENQGFFFFLIHFFFKLLIIPGFGVCFDPEDPQKDDRGWTRSDIDREEEEGEVTTGNVTTARCFVDARVRWIRQDQNHRRSVRASRHAAPEKPTCAWTAQQVGRQMGEKKNF